MKCIRLSVIVAFSALIASAAFAQQGTPPNLTRGPQAQGQGKPLVAAPTVKAPTATIQRDPFEVARTTDVNLSCMGPLRLEVTQNDQYDGSKGVGMKLVFKEAASATNIQPGHCWRQGSFLLAGITADGVSLNAGKGKGEMFHNPDLKKCPLMKSYAIDGGKLVEQRVNDGTIAGTMVDAATRAGPMTFASRWVDHKGGVSVGSSNTGWGRFTMSFGDAVSPGVPGCR